MHERRALGRILYAPYRAKSIRYRALKCCKVEAILQPRYEAARADLFFNSSRKSLRCLRLAVSHENCLGAGPRGAKPSDELVSVGVRGEAVCRAELSMNRDVLSVHPQDLGTFQ